MRALMGAQIARVWLDESKRRPQPRSSRRPKRRLLPAAVALAAVAAALVVAAQTQAIV